MPVTLEGSCRCGAVAFTMVSHTPQPYQLCYCTICRKTAGGGGFAINLAALSDSLELRGKRDRRLFRAVIDDPGRREVSNAERHFCARCGTALWVYDDRWPALIHPFASAIDSPLPVPPAKVHLMLRFKAAWVTPDIGPDDLCFDDFPVQSIEDWHKSRGLWVP